MQHTVLPNGQPPPKCSIHSAGAHLCGQKANETETGAALLSKNGERRNFDLTCNPLLKKPEKEVGSIDFCRSIE